MPLSGIASITGASWHVGCTRCLHRFFRLFISFVCLSLCVCGEVPLKRNAKKSPAAVAAAALLLLHGRHLLLPLLSLPLSPLCLLAVSQKSDYSFVVVFVLCVCVCVFWTSFVGSVSLFPLTSFLPTHPPPSDAGAEGEACTYIRVSLGRLQRRSVLRAPAQADRETDLQTRMRALACR